MDNQQGCSTRNSAQCYGAAWMGGEFGEEWIHVYAWLSPFPVHLKLSQHCLLTGYFVVVVYQLLSRVRLCNPMNCSMPGFSVLPYLRELAQTHVQWVSDDVQPSHSLLPSFPPALNLSHHQGLFQWVSSSHQVAEVLEIQLQHQSV